MNSKQRRTLQQIFELPTRSDVPWTDILAVFEALGARIEEGAGSRVRIKLRGVRAVFHRPHPERITHRGLLASVRKFLITAGQHQ